MWHERLTHVKGTPQAHGRDGRATPVMLKPPVVSVLPITGFPAASGSISNSFPFIHFGTTRMKWSPASTCSTLHQLKFANIKIMTATPMAINTYSQAIATSPSEIAAPEIRI